MIIDMILIEFLFDLCTTKHIDLLNNENEHTRKKRQMNNSCVYI